MEIQDFLIGRYFALWEHNIPYFLSTADVEPYRLDDLLTLADEESRLLWQNLGLGYTTTQGYPLLRAEIAGLYEGVHPENVLVFAGGEEAIFVLFNILLQPGDHAVVICPVYQSLYEVARAIGANVTKIDMSVDNGWNIDIDALRAAVRPNTRVIAMNFPNAPTGALPSHDIFAGICEIAQEAGAYLFSDESFRFLEYKQSDRLPAAVECYQRGLSLGSMSKAFALPGLRIGWIVTHDRALLDRMVRFKDYISVSCSSPSEILALIALRARNRVLSRSGDIIRHNLEHLDHFFSKWSDMFTWIRPQAANIAFPQLRGDIPIEQFAKELIEQEGVFILPGTVYEYPGNHFRIGFGRTDLPEVLARLERFTGTYSAQNI